MDKHLAATDDDSISVSSSKESSLQEDIRKQSKKCGTEEALSSEKDDDKLSSSSAYEEQEHVLSATKKKLHCKDEDSDEEDDLSSSGSHSSSTSSSSNDNTASEEEEEEEEEDLQDVPLEERLRQQQQKAGQTNNRTSAARERSSRALQVASERLQQYIIKANKNDTTLQKNKKKSKHAPTEASSKRFDFFQRGAPTLDSSGIGVEITAHRYKPRDPRALLLAKANNVTGAAPDPNFSFLQELRQQEIATLKKRIAVCKLVGKKGQKARKKLGVHRDDLQNDQEQLKRLLQEKAGYERAQLDATVKQGVKRKLKEQVAAGKSVYYPKKREMKRLQLEAKFEELRKRGGNAAVDKALAKRRKKAKSKDTGHLIPKNV